MQRRELLIAFIALSTSLQAMAQIRDGFDAVNQAGRQRMLVQRMAKSYVALPQGELAGVARKTLGESMASFEQQLAALRGYAVKADMKTAFERLDSAWQGFRAQLAAERAADVGHAGRVMSASNDMVVLANTGTDLIEAALGKPVARLVNVAGRQRMLSQRMAANYLCAARGVSVNTSVQQLSAAAREFEQAQQFLCAAPENSREVRDALELARQQFFFFQEALRTLQPGQADPRAQLHVFTTSERILQVMESVTGLYGRG